MTYDEIVEMTEEIGLPVAYDHFAEGESPEPPFLIFLIPSSSNFSADGRFRAELGNYVELDSALFYYLFTELFLMVDSRAKNMFPSFIGADIGGDEL